MSEFNLRRSSRRRDKVPDKFSVGMIVEVNRGRVRSNGRLVSKLTKDQSSTNPRWIVAFDDKSWPEEDMYESSFRKIVGKVENSSGQSAQKAKNDDQVFKKSNPSQSSSSTTGASTTNSHATQSRNKKKATVTPPPTPPEPVKGPLSNNDEASLASKPKKRKLLDIEEDHHSDDSRKKAKDREERRKRREAVVEEEKIKAGVHDKVVALAKKKSKGENVVRVDMLTGVLLLHRGPHRRAEFIFKK